MRDPPLERILKGGNSEITLLIFFRRLYIVYTHVTSKMNPVKLRSKAKTNTYIPRPVHSLLYTRHIKNEPCRATLGGENGKW